MLVIYRLVIYASFGLVHTISITIFPILYVFSSNEMFALKYFQNRHFASIGNGLRPRLDMKDNSKCITISFANLDLEPLFRGH